MLTYIVVDKFLSSRKFYKYSSIGVVLEICRVKKLRFFPFVRTVSQVVKKKKKKKQKRKKDKRNACEERTCLEPIRISNN